MANYCCTANILYQDDSLITFSLINGFAFKSYSWGTGFFNFLESKQSCDQNYLISHDSVMIKEASLMIKRKIQLSAFMMWISI